jgi:hypothetical protein
MGKKSIIIIKIVKIIVIIVIGGGQLNGKKSNLWFTDAADGCQFGKSEDEGGKGNRVEYDRTFPIIDVTRKIGGKFFFKRTAKKPIKCDRRVFLNFTIKQQIYCKFILVILWNLGFSEISFGSNKCI